MKRSAGRSLTLVVAVGALSLSGCSAPQEVAVTREGGEVVFAVCEEARTNRIEIYVVPKEGDPVDRLVWAADGEITPIEPPFVFTFGRALAGFVEEGPADALVTDGNYVAMYVDYDIGGVAQSQVFAQWDGDAISDEYWLSSSGARRDSPCG